VLSLRLNKIDYVPASDVVNAVKAELGDVLAQPLYSIQGKPGACGSAYRVYVHLSGALVDISLKTVRTNTNSPVASLAGGAILSILVSRSHMDKYPYSDSTDNLFAEVRGTTLDSRRGQTTARRSHEGA
jgi:hypothetical protein